MDERPPLLFEVSSRVEAGLEHSEEVSNYVDKSDAKHSFYLQIYALYREEKTDRVKEKTGFRV